jgi:hypothetical protein
MGLLVSDPELREQIEKLVGLYLQLPRQLVDSDLTHKTDFQSAARLPF